MSKKDYILSKAIVFRRGKIRLLKHKQYFEYFFPQIVFGENITFNTCPNGWMKVIYNEIATNDGEIFHGRFEGFAVSCNDIYENPISFLFHKYVSLYNLRKWMKTVS